MTSWFRSWHGAPTDNKWLVIATKAKVKPGIVSAVAWALFDHASQAEDRGSVKEFDTETYAVFSGFGENEVQAVIAAMCEKGVIDEDGRLAAWDKRQPKREDDSSERVRRHRDNQRASVTDKPKQDVTQCNAEKRSVTHGNNTEQSRADTEQNRTDTEKAAAAVDDTRTAQMAAVFECWKDNMPGTMTAILAEDIGDLADTYGADTVIRAITEAVRSNGRSLKYVASILKSWAAGGKPHSGTNGTNGTGYIKDSDRHVPNAWEVLMQQSAANQ